MEKYLNSQSQSKSIADSFTLPNTVTEYNKDTLLATIIRRYSTLPTLYDDPDWFYDECALWWDENKFAFTKMWEAMEKEYNPIENYSRVETKEGTITNSGSEEGGNNSETVVDGEVKGTGTIGDSFSSNGSVTVDGETKGTGTVTNTHTGSDTVVTDQDTSGETENKVSAFNETTYQNASKSVESGTLDSTVTDTKNLTDTETRNTKDEIDSTTTSNETNSNTQTRNTKDETDVTTNVENTYSKEYSNTAEEEYELHTIGNIGVTTSQQMLESEILLRKKFNLYKIMANTFADDMCLGIW